MLKLTLREGEKLHIGEAVLTVTRKGQQFGITVKAPLSVHVYRERVLEQLREMLSGKEVE
jgi:sRNA-binding carbon storage regulator CsrA